MTESLSLLRGRDIEITEGLVLRQPTLGEIETYNEFAFSSMLSTFICTPFDLIAELDKQGYDFTEITSYQLFCTTIQFVKKNETQILFKDFDFSELRPVLDNNKIILTNGSVVITESIYNKLSDCVRTVNAIPPPKFTGVEDDYTKKKMIEYAYEELEFSKRRKPKSSLSTLVSRVTNHPYFKYNLNDVWDMTVYAFYNAIKSINIVESSNQLSMGMYSGNLDLSKINKNDFNWLREIKD